MHVAPHTVPRPQKEEGMSATKEAPARARPPAKSKTFRIVFWIEGVAYSVLPLHPDPGVATRAYRLTRRDAKGKVVSAYDVSLSPEGHVACECKGFLRWQRPCKHIRCLAAAGMLPPLVTSPVTVQKSPAAEAATQEGGASDGQEAA
jgi:hypothetical protein